ASTRGTTTPTRRRRSGGAASCRTFGAAARSDALSARRAGATVGGRTHALLVQPLPQAAHPVGEEATELPRPRAIRPRSHRVAACGIGSKGERRAGPADRAAVAWSLGEVREEHPLGQLPRDDSAGEGGRPGHAG